MKKLVEELFAPQDRDNKDITPMLDTIGTISLKAMIKELEYKTKATYKYLSLSGSEYSWENFPETTKKAMLGKMATNDLAESSFAGVTSQVQNYGRIGMFNATDISDMSRNGYLSRPITKKDLKEVNMGLFHDLPEELRLAAVMAEMEDAPVTHKANNQSLELQRERRQEKEDLKEELGLGGAQENYIGALILHRMWYSHECCKTATKVAKRLKDLTFNKDKLDTLKDNTQISVIAFGWEEFKTQWSKDGSQK